MKTDNRKMSLYIALSLNTFLLYHFPIPFSGGSDGKESECRRPGFHPWVRKIPWRMKWLPTPVFLPVESHGLRSLVGSKGSQRLRHDWATKHTHTMKPAFWEKMWKPLSREAEGCLRFSYLQILSAGGLLISLYTAQVPRWIRGLLSWCQDTA